MASAAALEALRAAAFRHRPSGRVRSAVGALAFVEAVGFCSTFFRFPEGVACLWEAVVGRAKPRWPRRSHHDDGVGLDLAAQGRPAGGAARLLRQAAARPARAGRPRPAPGLLRARARPPARARLPRRVRGRPAVAHGAASHGRARARAPAVHARAARQHLPARAWSHARVRARHGRAAAGAVGGQERGALRADASRTDGSCWRHGCPTWWPRDAGSAGPPRSIASSPAIPSAPSIPAAPAFAACSPSRPTSSRPRSPGSYAPAPCTTSPSATGPVAGSSVLGRVRRA